MGCSVQTNVANESKDYKEVVFPMIFQCIFFISSIFLAFLNKKKIKKILMRGPKMRRAGDVKRIIVFKKP